MDDELVDILRCPNCADGLAGAEGRLDCQGCELPYPVLLDIPIAVPGPHEYLASYRESILATLAERDAGRAEIELALAFAEVGRGVEPRRFGDDWVASEIGGPVDEIVGGPVLGELDELLEATERSGLEQVLEIEMAPDVEIAVDLGCGAGSYTRTLAERADRVIAVDLSLRAVAHARSRAVNVDGVVGDIDVAIPLAEQRADFVLAANLFDIVADSPGAMVRAARLLRPSGVLIASSPDPNLGLPELADEIALLDGAIVAAGLEIVSARDGVPWVRRHDGRHLEIYLTRVVVARRPRLAIA